MRWILDTSAYSRRHVPEVEQQIRELLEENDDNELVLSPAVLIELLRAPEGDKVEMLRTDLALGFVTLPINDNTVELATDAQISLAVNTTEGHRMPISDLLTAAVAHQQGCGVAHIDSHFTMLARHTDLRFQERRLQLPSESAGTDSAIKRVRDLRKQLARELSRKASADAAGVLEQALEAAELLEEPKR